MDTMEKAGAWPDHEKYENEVLRPAPEGPFIAKVVLHHVNSLNFFIHTGVEVLLYLLLHLFMTLATFLGNFHFEFVRATI